MSVKEEKSQHKKEKVICTECLEELGSDFEQGICGYCKKSVWWEGGRKIKITYIDYELIDYSYNDRNSRILARELKLN